MTTNETDNTKQGLLNRFHVAVSALYEAHGMSKDELTKELEDHLDGYEYDTRLIKEECSDCGCVHDSNEDCIQEPDDSMDGDFDSGMASAGYGTDEDYGYYGGNEE